jgi:tetratricopeptide (TPR) repeat protein
VSVPEGLLSRFSLRLALQIAVGLVLVVLVVAAGWFWYQTRESQGLLALAEASTLAQQAQGPDASSEARERAVQALEAVMTDYPRLSALPQAAYQLGNLRYRAGQYAAARGAYEVALAKGATGTVRTLAALGIGYGWEAEKAYDKALTAYEAAARSLGAKDFLYEEALLDQARAQELVGKPSAAIETYRRIIKEVPDSRRADEVQSKLAYLESRAGK